MKPLQFFLFFVFLYNCCLSQPMVDPVSRIEEYGSPEKCISLPVYNENIFNTIWDTLTSSPTPFGRTVHGVIGNYFYVFSSQLATSMAQAYHIPTNTWVTSTPVQFGAFNSGFCVARGAIYKMSGSGATTTAEKFTPAGDGTGTWTNFTPAPTALMNAQNSMVWDGQDYIYTYSSGTSSPYPSYFYRMNMTTQVWEARASSFYPRRYAGMAQLKGFIYLIGGLKSDTSPENVCQKYNPLTDSWTQIASLPENVNFTKWSVDSDNKYVYLIGSGGGFSGYTVSNKVYYYDPLTDAWAEESTLPAVRGLPVGVFVPGFNQLIFGGGNDGVGGTNFQSTVWGGVGGVYIPVELTDFKIITNNLEITLFWETASETNNDQFIVERSSDGESFAQIVNIKGAGNSVHRIGYSYKDPFLQPGKYFYRLKQIDYNGRYSYSNIQSVVLTNTEFTFLENYPNPFNPSTNIVFTISDESNVKISVFNSIGSLVQILLDEKKGIGKHEVTFDASGFSTGLYYLKLECRTRTISRPILLLK